MNALQTIEIFAGFNPDGQSIAEKIQVSVLDNGDYQLVRSPAFVKGLASADIIKFDVKDQSFEIVKHSGNVCIRVFAKEDMTTLAQDLTAEIEKLGGELDIQNDRFAVFSIHVSIGFKAIEALLNDLVGEDTESAWFYGNVYDPKDGVTPLNWWLDILKPQ